MPQTPFRLTIGNTPYHVIPFGKHGENKFMIQPPTGLLVVRDGSIEHSAYRNDWKVVPPEDCAEIRALTVWLCAWGVLGDDYQTAFADEIKVSGLTKGGINDTVEKAKSEYVPPD